MIKPTFEAMDFLWLFALALAVVEYTFYSKKWGFIMLIIQVCGMIIVIAIFREAIRIKEVLG